MRVLFPQYVHMKSLKFLVHRLQTYQNHSKGLNCTEAFVKIWKNFAGTRAEFGNSEVYKFLLSFLMNIFAKNVSWKFTLLFR